MESMKANFSHWAMIIRIRAGMVTGGGGALSQFRTDLP